MNQHKFQLVVFVGFLAGAAPLATGQDLAANLRALDQMRTGPDTRLDLVDRRGEALLAQYEEPADQAQIHYQLAHVHSQSGLKAPAKVILYCEAALKSKLVSPEQRGTLQSYLSSAQEVNKEVPEFAERRRLALQPLLSGLAELQAMNVPQVAPERPDISITKGAARDGIEQAAQQRAIAAAQAAWDQVERTKNLINRRDVLRSQVKWLYAREPLADAELLEMATKIVNVNEAKQLVASAKNERDRVAAERLKNQQRAAAPEDGREN